MGKWQATIVATGTHDMAEYPVSAEEMVKSFVEELRAKGHSVEFVNVSACVHYEKRQGYGPDSERSGAFIPHAIPLEPPAA